MNTVSRDSTPKSYDWAHPQDKQIQFCFYLRDGFVWKGQACTRTSVVVDPEWAEEIPESASPYETACMLVEMLDKRMLYCGQLEKLRAATVFLEGWQEEDKLEFLRTEEERLQSELAEVQEKLG